MKKKSRLDKKRKNPSERRSHETNGEKEARLAKVRERAAVKIAHDADQQRA